MKNILVNTDIVPIYKIYMKTLTPLQKLTTPIHLASSSVLPLPLKPGNAGVETIFSNGH